MSVNQIGSTTTIYAKTNLAGVSSTTPTSQLATASTTASTTATVKTNITTASVIVRNSSATATATSSATIAYGASSTAKIVVSSTTARSVSSTTSRAVSKSTGKVVSSTTAKTSSSSIANVLTGSTTAKKGSGSTTPGITSSSTTSILINNNITRVKTSSDTVSIALRNEAANPYPVIKAIEIVETVRVKECLAESQKTTIDYAYLSHMGDAGQAEVEKALVELGFDNETNGEFVHALEAFKKSVGMDEYNSYSQEVIDKLNEVYDAYKESQIRYVTKEKLIGIGFENVDDEMVYDLNCMLEKYGITDKNEINHFLAQCYVESAFGKSVVQKRWTVDDKTDEEYFNERNYMNENLGNTEPEDGYKYRGAGYIQITGRYNYNEFSKYMSDPLILEEGTIYVANNYAWEASGWFWMTFVHEVFERNSSPTVEEVTVEINDNFDGLQERKKEYDRITEYDMQQENYK